MPFTPTYNTDNQDKINSFVENLDVQGLLNYLSEETQKDDYMAATKAVIEEIGDYNPDVTGLENPLWEKEAPKKCSQQPADTTYSATIVTVGTQEVQQGGKLSAPGYAGDLSIELPEDYAPQGTAAAYYSHVTIFGHKK